MSKLTGLQMQGMATFIFQRGKKKKKALNIRITRIQGLQEYFMIEKCISIFFSIYQITRTEKNSCSRKKKEKQGQTVVRISLAFVCNFHRSYTNEIFPIYQ